MPVRGSPEDPDSAAGSPARLRLIILPVVMRLGRGNPGPYESRVIDST
jgi:hypothetical protein